MSDSRFRSASDHRPGASEQDNAIVFYLAVGGIVLIALGLRWIGLAQRSFWTDEGYSFWFQGLSWRDLWTKLPLYETHPPFYYSVLKLWSHLFGITEVGMRSLSVLASLLTVALVAVAPNCIRRGAVARLVGLSAAMLLAVNEGSIEYAQQARPYALLTLAVLVMLLCSVSLVSQLFTKHENDTGTRSIAFTSVVLGISGGLTLWLHNTSAFIIFANWIGLGAVVLGFSRKKVRDFVVICRPLLLAIVIWLPCVPILLVESRTVSESFWASISPGMITWPLTLATGGEIRIFSGRNLIFLWNEEGLIRECKNGTLRLFGAVSADGSHLFRFLWI